MKAGIELARWFACRGPSGVTPCGRGPGRGNAGATSRLLDSQPEGVSANELHKRSKSRIHPGDAEKILQALVDAAGAWGWRAPREKGGRPARVAFACVHYPASPVGNNRLPIRQPRLLLKRMLPMGRGDAWESNGMPHAASAPPPAPPPPQANEKKRASCPRGRIAEGATCSTHDASRAPCCPKCGRRHHPPLAEPGELPLAGRRVGRWRSGR